MRSGGQILVESLAALGADTGFGVPGQSYLAVLDALHDTRGRLDLVLCRNEGGLPSWRRPGASSPAGPASASSPAARGRPGLAPPLWRALWVLRGQPLELKRADEVERRMAPDGIVESVDAARDRGGRLCPGVTIIRLGFGIPPVAAVGFGVAANALSVGVNAATVAGDYGLFWASSPSNDSADPTGGGLSGFLASRSTTPPHCNAVGGRVLTGGGDSQSFTKATGNFLRLFAESFRHASGIVGTPVQNSGTGTSITVPAMTVSDPGSCVVVKVSINANDGGALRPIDVGGGLVNARTFGNTVNGSPLSIHYVVLQDVFAFAGGTISWAGSAGYQYSVHVLR